MSISIPKNRTSSVAAWLAQQGHTLLTAPPSLIADALASTHEACGEDCDQSSGRLGLDSTNHAP